METIIRVLSRSPRHHYDEQRPSDKRNRTVAEGVMLSAARRTNTDGPAARPFSGGGHLLEKGDKAHHRSRPVPRQRCADL